MRSGICYAIFLSLDVDNFAIILGHELHPSRLLLAQLPLAIKVFEGPVVHVHHEWYPDEVGLPLLKCANSHADSHDSLNKSTAPNW